MSEAEKQPLADHLTRCDRCFAAVAALLRAPVPQRATPVELLARAQAAKPRAQARRWYAWAAVAALVLLIGSLWSVYRLYAPPTAGYELVEVPLSAPELGLAQEYEPLPSRGRVRALVVFAQFAEEAGMGDQPPDFSADLFDPDLPGSFTHFYTTMSFGQLQVEGTVLPKRYTSDRPARAYLSKVADQRGRYDWFAEEVLRQADAEVDLGQFDNDGPDGLPNSGDDDGLVDYVFVIVRRTPRHFILGGATGIVGLNLEVDYQAADTSPGGSPLRISGSRAHGALLGEGTFAQTVGTMAHEFGHSLGLPDLYDLAYDNPERDSAGIGKWGLMGQGAPGWKDGDGPNPFCAWSLEQLGWIGRDNERLVEIRRDTTDLEIASFFQQGYVYKIPLELESTQPGILSQSYLLLEERIRGAHHYEGQLPGEGVLVWHIRSRFRDTADEKSQLVALVCADGLYQDAGFPLGRVAAPREGGDNLDFWAHDQTYKTAHQGNLGDAADLFDGIRFTRLGPDSNPSTSGWGQPSEALSGLAVDLRRRGSAMLADIRLPRWAGTIREKVRWAGEVLVDGDLTIAPGGVVILYSNAHIRFAGSDRLQGGRDPALCELHIQGDLREMPPPVKLDVQGVRQAVEPVPTVFEALIPGQRWWGVLPAGSAKIQVMDRLVLRDSEYGLLVPGFEPGGEVPTAILEEPKEESPAFALLPNYPNPFDQETTLRYTLAASSQVRLIIYDALGQIVRVLVDDHQPEGSQEVVWNGRDESGQGVASGVYLYYLEVPGQYQAQGKMMMMRSGPGFSALDKVLQEHKRAWPALRSKLAPPAEPAFGFAAELSVAQIAFTAGTTWFSLQLVQRQSRTPQDARPHAELLKELLRGFDPSLPQLQALESLSAQLQAGRVAPQQLDQAHRAIAQLFQTHSEEAAQYFYLGEWLQGLRVAGLVTRRLDLPLSEMIDLSASAAIARQFRAELGALRADEALLASLDRLAILLDSRLDNEKEVEEALEVLERIADPLTAH
ncbi:MAG: immune inhibitor A [Candidatus Latescibacteria bacterium]|nr:immune inhibitor A [Candidatus Latescibacterota bacterium]